MNIYVPSTWRRLFAFVVDFFITSSMALPMLLRAWGASSQHQGLWFSWEWLLATWLLQFLYHVLFLYFLGATVGKLFFGLRVVPVQAKQASLSFFQCVLRVLTDQLGFFFGHFHRIFAFYRLDRRHISDWVAETRVVQFSPRNSMPGRRWILATIALYFMTTNSFEKTYQNFKKMEIRSDGVLFRTDINWDFRYESYEQVYEIKN